MSWDPSSPGYDWIYTDQLVAALKAQGLGVLIVHHHARPVLLPRPTRAACAPAGPAPSLPKIGEFEDFAKAVVKRYGGKVDYYSIGNDFNLGKNWVTPRYKRSGRIRYDHGASVYRKMWIAGHRAISRYDPSQRNRVLFAETAAIAKPLPFIRNALCIDTKGRALKGKLARLQGCSGKVKKLNIGGMAVHPYNSGGNGTPRSARRGTRPR